MKLIVRPLKQKDAGRGLAAIDRQAAEELGLEGGDFIRLVGQNGSTIARVWPGYPEDHGSGVIRIDGRLRQQANVGIDDRVEVEKADVKPASRVTVALPQNLRIGGNIGTYIRDKLAGQPVTTGQTVQLPLGFGFMSSSNQTVPLRVASTQPSGTVVSTTRPTSRSPRNPPNRSGRPPAVTTRVPRSPTRTSGASTASSNRSAR